MTDIQTVEYSLPSHWASALIYGDTSGLEDSEIQDMNLTLASIDAREEGSAYCVGVKDDQEFAQSDFDHPYGDVSTFVFQITKE